MSIIPTEAPAPITYTWEVKSVEPIDGTMLVEFTHEGAVALLNLQAPADATVDLGEWIDKFAPRGQWEEHDVSHITLGTTGEAQVVKPPPPEKPPVAAPESPHVVGSWNEEYIRALIYQVLEEIKETKV